jgi:hypothetical protein
MITRLFENLELDWERLAAPARGLDQAPIALKGQRGPTLASLCTEDLRSTSSLLALHRWAVRRRILVSSEAGLLAFLATAEYCLRVGENPAALFRTLVARGQLQVATLEDEDRAVAALKNHRLGNNLDPNRSPSGFLVCRSKIPDKP